VVLVLYAVVSEHLLTSLLDRSSGVACGNVGKRRQWEVLLELATTSLDEVLPHESARGVVREWEVYSLVEELLEILLGA